MRRINDKPLAFCGHYDHYTIVVVCTDNSDMYILANNLMHLELRKVYYADIPKQF